MSVIFFFFFLALCAVELRTAKQGNDLNIILETFSYFILRSTVILIRVVALGRNMP